MWWTFMGWVKTTESFWRSHNGRELVPSFERCVDLTAATMKQQIRIKTRKQRSNLSGHKPGWKAMWGTSPSVRVLEFWRLPRPTWFQFWRLAEHLLKPERR